eukprot:TRINITY_DN1722_c0_g1_i3.p1 TRINITY_DN1722_c0_g1~~TRINITY_DN1722_c0_g1_i3.p1  ORF type:complete len:359 (+),score=92.91 TRINITY_DN1722_c0_g1_i3:25-1077(+)
MASSDPSALHIAPDSRWAHTTHSNNNRSSSSNNNSSSRREARPSLLRTCEKRASVCTQLERSIAEQLASLQSEIDGIGEADGGGAAADTSETAAASGAGTAVAAAQQHEGELDLSLDDPNEKANDDSSGSGVTAAGGDSGAASGEADKLSQLLGQMGGVDDELASIAEDLSVTVGVSVAQARTYGSEEDLMTPAAVAQRGQMAQRKRSRVAGISPHQRGGTVGSHSQQDLRPAAQSDPPMLQNTPVVTEEAPKPIQMKLIPLQRQSSPTLQTHFGAPPLPTPEAAIYDSDRLCALIDAMSARWWLEPATGGGCFIDYWTTQQLTRETWLVSSPPPFSGAANNCNSAVHQK